MDIFQHIRPWGHNLSLLLVSGYLLAGCHPTGQKTLFDRLGAGQTGISFSNTITESDSVNLFVNEYAYMGGGVGIGDFDKDGKQDIFFTGSQVSCRLYRNKGGNQFEDVTEKAGLHTDAWCTGVSVVDINNDGYPDLYVCVSGNLPGKTRRNLLFINNHDLTFTESAKAYGLDYSGYSTQAVFFDYDKDGDLDMYLLNHRLDHNRPNNIVGRDSSGSSPAADKLFCNTGIDPRTHHPLYKDVSLAAGIRDDGYGLGVVVSDFNGDHWPDIYVSNDYLGNDELWLNNKNGTFTNTIASSVRHQSYSGMGVDAADINNDGLNDLMTLDMMPEENSRKKKMYSFMSYERYQMERDAGYQPEYMRNMLQLNRGGQGSTPFFSEIGQLAGVSETDWSWSVLLADFDNDGWKDIHITNGIGKDLTNADFVQFRADSHLEDNNKEGDERATLMKKLNSYGPVRLANYFFLNNHDLTFRNASAEAGITEPTTSNGAVYADLDNDGDLDLVINNVNQPASVLINTTKIPSPQTDSAGHHFLRFSLTGTEQNRDAIGTSLTLYYRQQQQTLEEYPVRGYLSSVDPVLHAGLGNIDRVDSIRVVWPDDRTMWLRDVKADQTLTLVEAPGAKSLLGTDLLLSTAPTLLTDVTLTSGVDYSHRETFFNDYSFQRLLTQKYSQLGPLLSVADVNRDGLADFFVGGAFNHSGRVYLQKKDGSFEGSDLVNTKKEEEDMGSCFFDINGDGFADLLVTGGSDEFSPGSPVYIPRMYINDGKGRFRLEAGAVPSSVNTSASVAIAADINDNGQVYVFIGGRVSAQFPASPRSYLLRSEGGILKDVTSLCPALAEAGMVTSAVWVDFDGDRRLDLVIAGEWMPIRFFRNRGDRLEEVTSTTGLTGMTGQWRSLVAADIDHDGDMDLVAGNLGLNNKYHMSAAEPLLLYAGDIDHNGITDPVSFYYIKDKTGARKSYPGISRDQFSQQVPSIKKRFLYYTDYASALFSSVYSKDQQKDLLRLSCEESRSVWLENKGQGQWVLHPLPTEAQFAPVNAIIWADLDGDGKEDLLLAGNEYQTEPMTGRYDASWGSLLHGDGKGGFTAVTPAKSGLQLSGDVKDLRAIRSANGSLLVLAGINDEHMKVLKVNN